MINYSWKFRAEVAEVGGLEDVIKVVAWTLTASDGVREVETSSRLGFPDPDPKNFVPFEALTQETLVQWVETNPAIDLPKLKEDLAAELAKDPAPAPVVLSPKTLPFDVEPEVA
jgi:hypothetical protein